MTGIEVLAAQEVATKFAFNYINFCIIGGFVFGLCILLGVVSSELRTGIVMGILLGAFFGFLAGFSGQTPTAYETHYKVTISDEVSMNDFLEKYEIIDQEGKIYTVVERND